MSVATAARSRLVLIIDGNRDSRVTTEVQDLSERAVRHGFHVIRYAIEGSDLVTSEPDDRVERNTLAYRPPISKMDDDHLWIHVAQGNATDDWPAHVLDTAGVDDLLVATGVDPWTARRLRQFIPPSFAPLPRMFLFVSTDVGRCGHAFVWRSLRDLCGARPDRIRVGSENPMAAARHLAPSLRPHIDLDLRISDILPLSREVAP